MLGWQNQGVVGVDYDDSQDDFNELTQYGGIAPDHQLVYEPSPYNDFPTGHSVGGSNKILGTYFTDTLSPSHLLHVTAAARYNRNPETIDGYLGRRRSRRLRQRISHAEHPSPAITPSSASIRRSASR